MHPPLRNSPGADSPRVSANYIAPQKVCYTACGPYKTLEPPCHGSYSDTYNANVFDGHFPALDATHDCYYTVLPPYVNRFVQILLKNAGIYPNGALYSGIFSNFLR